MNSNEQKLVMISGDEEKKKQYIESVKAQITQA